MSIVNHMKSKLSEVSKILQRFHGGPDAGDATIEDAFRESAPQLHAIDPETKGQWLRLQRTIEQDEMKAIPARARLVPRLALGAAVVAIAAAAFYLYTSSPQPAPETFATQTGEQKEIVLGDGSQVTLNYSTELVASAQRPDKPRRVSLTGEAYFRVQHAGIPFIVSTQGVEVEVVGTEFDVRERNGAVEIGVIRGTVAVRVVKDGKDSTILLTQHQMGLCPQNGFPMRLEDISSLEYPGWMHSKLLLDKTSFLEACRELEMRFGVTITVHDQILREKVITGILDARTAESGLAALCELTGNKFTHAGKTYDVD